MKQTICLVLITVSIVTYAVAQPNRQVIDSVRKLTEQDHKKMLALLHIDSLRPGPSGNPQAANAANADESKATPYQNLPDPLYLRTGRKLLRLKCGGKSGVLKSLKILTVRSLAGFLRMFQE